MEINLLKTLLSSQVYENHQQRLRRSIFADEHLQLLDLIIEGHSKYENDLQPDDLFAMWMMTLSSMFPRSGEAAQRTRSKAPVA